jgi:hypothetical protein
MMMIEKKESEGGEGEEKRMMRRCGIGECE